VSSGEALTVGHLVDQTGGQIVLLHFQELLEDPISFEIFDIPKFELVSVLSDDQNGSI